MKAYSSSDYSGTVNHWILFDAFTAFEHAEREREANERIDKPSEPLKTENVEVDHPGNEKKIESKMLRAAIIMERMLNLNTFHEIAQVQY